MNIDRTYYSESDREEYERQLKERQENHMKQVYGWGDILWRPCLHDNCPLCNGTGIKLDRSQCIHMISCPCPKCTPYF